MQTGGPSGGVHPRERCSTCRWTSTSSPRPGSMMGSGGMIVMDEDTCMVDVARYFLDVPRRRVLRQVRALPRGHLPRCSHILQRLCQGEGRTGDVEALEDLADTVLVASLCALGQSAPNPVLSSIKYFRDEYVAHVEEKRCPACMCKALTNYWIDPDKCIACGMCRKECPVEAISGEKKRGTRHRPGASAPSATPATRCARAKVQARDQALGARPSRPGTRAKPKKTGGPRRTGCRRRRRQPILSSRPERGLPVTSLEMVHPDRLRQPPKRSVPPEAHRQRPGGGGPRA